MAEPDFIITREWLRDNPACPSAYKDFLKHVPQGITYQAAIEALLGMRREVSAQWLIRQLGPATAVREIETLDVGRSYFFVGILKISSNVRVEGLLLAGGNLLVNGNIEAASVMAGGSILAKGDIVAVLDIGAGGKGGDGLVVHPFKSQRPGSIKAAGNIKASNIVATQDIEAGGSITAYQEIKTGGIIKAGGKIDAPEGPISLWEY